MNSLGMFGGLCVVAHGTGLVTQMTRRSCTVIIDGGAAVPAVLPPGIRDEYRPAQEQDGDHCEQQDRGPEDVLGVDEWALRIHRMTPPWSTPVAARQWVVPW